MQKPKFLSCKVIMLQVMLLVCFVLSQTALAQQTLTYFGTIKNNRGEPLERISVSIKETSTGTTTSSSGEFTISAQPGQTLVVSSVGHSPKELTLTTNTTIDFVLEELANSLEDVIVVAYGTQRRKDVTAAISNVKAEDLVRTPAVTATSALVGRVPGITARQTDARPGAGTNIQIRNMGNPLYIIDGVQAGVGQFNNLNMNDIEDISILKDGAAAIYGVRASNGVVLVTTKKGRAGQKPTINLNGYYGLQNYTRFPYPADAYHYMLGLQESAQNQGRANTITPEELEKWRVGTEKGYQSFDYYDFIMRPNVPQTYVNASTTGGGEKMNYYFSVGNLNQKAIINDYYFRRTNVQANIEASIVKGLKIGTQLYGREEKRHAVGVPGLDDYFNPFLSVFTMWPTERPYANDNPKYINQTHNVNVNPATYTEEVTGYTDEWWRGFKGNFFAEYKTKFGLTARGTVSYNYTTMEFDGFEYTYDAYNYDAATDTYFTRPGWGNQNPWRERRNGREIERFGQVQLNYSKKFGDHALDVVTAYERLDYNRNYMAIHTVPPNNYIPIMNFANQDYLGHEMNEWARAGYVGRINYNYREKYLIEALGRYDGSYIYRPQDRWGFFPGVSVGWRVSRESFLNGAKGWLSDLKFRASYGETGDDVVNPFLYLSGYDFLARNAVFNGGLVIGIDPRGLPVTNLTWTRNKATNIGFDIGLFDNKLTGQFDVFQKKRTGIPYANNAIIFPVEPGYGLPNENMGSDVVKGMEGSLSYNNTAGQLTYSVGANATFARYRRLTTNNPTFGNDWDRYRNSPLDRWANVGWGYHVIGRFQSQEEIDNYQVDIDGQGNRTLLPGDFIYDDANKDNIINSLDERPIGYAEGATPYLSFGLSSTLLFKGFNLNIDFAGASKQSFFREWELKYPYQNNGSAPHYMLEDRWHREDPFDPNSKWIPGTYPAVRKDWPGHSSFRRSDFWVTNITYVRLRNLELGYTFPKTFNERIGITNLKVYVNGTNLFSIDNVKDLEIDPEIGPTNGLVYPQQRLINFGLNVTL